jgi:hypothetical protein
MLIGITIGNQIINVLPATSLFPFAAFFFFIAVLPLFYAPETLPEVVMKGRDIKSYTEKALKKAQEQTNKGFRKAETRRSKDDDECKQEETGDEFEKARKLAEKYY